MELARRYKGKIAERYKGDSSIAILRYHGRYALCISGTERELLRDIENLRRETNWAVEVVAIYDGVKIAEAFEIVSDAARKLKDGEDVNLERILAETSSDEE